MYSAPKLVKALGEPSSLWQTVVWGYLGGYITDEETEGCTWGGMTAWGYILHCLHISMNGSNSGYNDYHNRCSDGQKDE